uniref:Natural killer cell granule protein 7 n=1 Tax=Pelodiscus sinensis TaxID=13735 RepID=K7FNU4_PELSI
MQACSVGSCLLAALSLLLLCLALSTDYWLVAYGPKDTFHSGLWQQCTVGRVNGYIQATRAFLILAALAAAVCILSLLSSIISCFQSPVSLSLVASLSAFAAAGCTLVSMAVFSAESWDKNKDGQIQLTFEWSFYLGWAALPLLVLSGCLGPGSAAGPRAAQFRAY